MRYRPFRYPLPLGSAFGSEKSSGRKQQLMQTKRPETLRFRVFLARREGFEPPAFWSVGCLKGKSEPFRLRFVLFTTVRSTNFSLFPSSPTRFFRVLGQNWVNGNFQSGECNLIVTFTIDTPCNEYISLLKLGCYTLKIKWPFFRLFGRENNYKKRRYL